MNSIQEKDFQTTVIDITKDEPNNEVEDYSTEEKKEEEETDLNKKSTQSEKEKPKKINSYNYGTAINVNNHKMIVDIKGESNEPTIVFLTGFITPSPVINYRPLSELLSKTYKFIIIEPFGYGLSDSVDEERTIENVTAELHRCIEQLHLKNYYLMAHSLGVVGFIGFDTIAPKINSFDDSGNKDSLAKGAKTAYWFNLLGLNRMMSLFNKSNLIIHLSKRFKYTDEEISMFRNIELAKSINKNIVSEGENTIRGLEVIDNMKFPKNMTLLHYLSTQNTNGVSNFKQCHIDVGSESLSNEVIILEGKHYDFLIQHNDEITKKLSTFFKK
ncbi:hypothetical protein PIROE2DRAFT_12821 [Piromyces sp. E2]|nr:hypothetical protein PIROE2DRAFT_12821 [Piromyces sp. E2]|eukprot:OUM61236.1 hypothetical protein PIROE2DRAFT_12821 [Piromyces sp. E2]